MAGVVRFHVGRAEKIPGHCVGDVGQAATGDAQGRDGHSRFSLATVLTICAEPDRQPQIIADMREFLRNAFNPTGSCPCARPLPRSLMGGGQGQLDIFHFRNLLKFRLKRWSASPRRPLYGAHLRLERPRPTDARAAAVARSAWPTGARLGVLGCAGAQGGCRVLRSPPSS